MATLPLHLDEPYHVAPSDLAFLYQECVRCFYEKVRRNVRRPGVFPSFFNAVDRGMKQAYGDGAWHDIAQVARLTETGLQPLEERLRFRVLAQDGWVASQPLDLGAGAVLQIRGVFDTVVEIEGSSLAICDFKMTFPRHEHLRLYRRPLHAYAYALERGLDSGRHHYEVPRLGLLVFAGTEFAANDRYAGICGPLTWVELDRTDDLFFRFMSRLARKLALPEPPAPSPTCPFCRYRGAVQEPRLLSLK